MINRKSFLIKSFEEYHQIIFKYRKKIKESSLFSQTDTDEIKVNKSFLIQSEIISFIKAKSAEILYETGKIGESIFDEVSYVMASLADEVFIVLNWDGKDYWKNNLIEQQLFHSQNSGEFVFNKISAVLQDQSMESSELALIYFYCLALGFQGAKRSLDDCEKQIQELKAKLYYKIYYKDSKLFKEKLLLFPKSYDSLFTEKNILFENPLIFWKKIFIFTIIAYFIFVEFIWNYKMKIVFNLFSGCIGG